MKPASAIFSRYPVLPPLLLATLLSLAGCSGQASSEMGAAADQAKEAAHSARKTLEALGNTTSHVASGAAQQWEAVKNAVSPP